MVDRCNAFHMHGKRKKVNHEGRIEVVEELLALIKRGGHGLAIWMYDMIAGDECELLALTRSSASARGRRGTPSRELDPDHPGHPRRRKCRPGRRVVGCGASSFVARRGCRELRRS